MKKLITILILAPVILAVQSQSVHLQWAKTFGTSGAEVAPYDVVADTAQNLYYCGSFEGTMDLNPGSGVANHTSAGGKDAYVIKVDKFGNLAWIRTYGSTQNDYASKMAIDPAGNIFITGNAGNSIDYDEGPGTVKLPNSSNFLLKLSSDGVFKFVVQPTGSTMYDIALDPSNNIFITGNFYGSNIDFDPSANTTYMSSKGDADVFIAKFSSAGAFLWARQLGGADGDYPSGLAVDKFGNPHVTGTFRGTADFDPGAGTLNFVSKGLGDIFICKLLSIGTLSYAKQIGTTADDYASDIATDLNSNAYAVGTFTTTMDLNPGSSTFELTPAGDESTYLLKLNYLGDFVWVSLYENTLFSQDVQIEYFENKLYIAGNFTDSVDVNPGSGASLQKQTPGGWYGTFVSVIDTTQNFITGFYIGKRVSAKVAPFKNGGLYMVGDYWSTLDCDPGPDTTELTSLGNADVFLVKYELGDITGIQESRTEQVSVYPNPGSGIAYLTLPEFKETAKIAIYNNTGKLVAESQIRDTKTAEIQLPEKQGLYYIQVRTDLGITGRGTVIRN